MKGEQEQDPNSQAEKCAQNNKNENFDGDEGWKLGWPTALETRPTPSTAEDDGGTNSASSAETKQGSTAMGVGTWRKPFRTCTGPMMGKQTGWPATLGSTGGSREPVYPAPEVREAKERERHDVASGHRVDPVLADRRRCTAAAGSARLADATDTHYNNYATRTLRHRQYRRKKEKD